MTVQPTATTTYTLTVRSGWRKATTSTTVSVLASSAVVVSISPSSASVETGRSQPFQATAQNATNSAVTWSVQEGDGGTIAADGTYLAPPTTGTFHVVATSVEDPNASATATVQVTAPPPVIPAGSVVVYDDALEGGWQDWSWVTLDLSASSPVSGGVHSIAVSYGPWTGLSFELPGGVSGMGAGTLEFDVNGGSNVLPAINGVIQSGGVWGPEVGISPYCAGGGIPTNRFAHCSVPLAALQAADKTFDRIAFKEALGHTLGGMAFDQIVIEPASSAPAIQSFTASPAILASGGSATLAATYSGGVGVIDNGAGAIASGGSVSVKPAATTTYTLTVSDGAGHTATSSVTVTVTAGPAIQSFTASPGSINTGSGSTLSATYTGGTGSIDNGLGAIASGGRITVTPGSTTTYTLTVADSLGQKATQSVTVTVVALPSIQSFTANPASIAAGGSSTLSASYDGGAGVIDNGVGALASGGNVSVQPGTTTTYTLTVTDSAGHSATSSATVTVGAGSPGSILPPDRVTAWNPGLMSLGGVPNRTAICATVSASTYGNGAQDATAGIQAAINGCPEGQVVQLSAGTFTINNDIVYLNKGITLRGAGVGTVLQRTNGARAGSYVPGVSKPVIIVGPARWGSGGTAFNLAADGVKGATSVQLASAPAGGLFPGQIVLVDELSGAGWQTDPAGRGQIWASPDFRVVYQRHNPSQGTDDPFPDAAGWFSRQDRVTAETKEVRSWDAATRTVTFTSPFHIDYRASHTAQLYVYNDKHVKNAGVEDLKLQGGDDGQLRFLFAAYSWAARVENTAWLGEGFAINHSFRVEVRDSYVHTPVWFEPGGGSYNISLANGSAEILIENNISVDADKVMVARCSGAGSVVGYNYMDDGHIGSAPTWVEIGLNASHMVGPHHVLFEGNYAFNWDSDKTHGNSIYQTIFRNHLSGKRRSFTDGGPRRCAGATYYSYWMSYVGNVLGLAGQMSGWVYESTSIGTPGIWLLGWDDWSPYPIDPRVRATAIRHGNFDYLTNAVAWDPANSNHTLPPSLYLSRKPAFFDAGSGYAWPWVDPTSAAPVRTLPAKARYDAGTPFRQP